MTEATIVPETYAEKLLVTTWHIINMFPQHHNQSNWACGTSFCTAGWVATLDGVHEWGQLHEQIIVQYLRKDGGEWQPIEGYVKKLLAENDEDKYSVLYSLFLDSPKIEQVHKNMTEFLGYDPADAIPDEEMLLKAKFTIADFDTHGVLINPVITTF